MINDIRISPHFKLKEFQCRCCGLVKLSPKLLQALEYLRDEAQSPLIITSGYRCPAHNARVGGARGSLHIEGRAADILADYAAQKRFSLIAESIGFKEVIRGGKKGYLHIAYI